MKVLDVVKEPLDIIKKGSKRKREEKAREVLKTVGLPDFGEFLERCCHALSGGQRQRLAAARSLVTSLKLLIADEVTSMLDPSTQANLLRELKGLKINTVFPCCILPTTFTWHEKFQTKCMLCTRAR